MAKVICFLTFTLLHLRSSYFVYINFVPAFVEACLIVYRGSVEDVIDAIVSNNLSPKLSHLDPHVDRITVGKGNPKDASKQITIGGEFLKYLI